MPDDHEALDDAVADLEAALDSLRDELERAPDAADGESAPEEQLRLVTEVALPTLEGLLAANLRTLEATREAVRGVQREVGAEGRDGAARDGATDDGATGDGGGRDDAADPGEPPHPSDITDAAERVDAAVEEVRDALEGSSVPEDAPGRDLLQEARDLRREIGSEVDEASDAADRGGRAGGRDGQDRHDGDRDGGGHDGDEADRAGEERSGTTDASERREIPIRTSSDDGADASDEADGSTTGRGDAATQREDDATRRADDAERDAERSRPERDRREPDRPEPDVEAELETIKQQVESDRNDPPPWADDEEWSFDGDDSVEDGEGNDGTDEQSGSDDERTPGDGSSGSDAADEE